MFEFGKIKVWLLDQHPSPYGVVPLAPNFLSYLYKTALGQGIRFASRANPEAQLQSFLNLFLLSFLFIFFLLMMVCTLKYHARKSHSSKPSRLPGKPLLQPVLLTSLCYTGNCKMNMPHLCPCAPHRQETGGPQRYLPPLSLLIASHLGGHYVPADWKSWYVLTLCNMISWQIVPWKLTKLQYKIRLISSGDLEIELWLYLG